MCLFLYTALKVANENLGGAFLQAEDAKVDGAGWNGWNGIIDD